MSDRRGLIVVDVQKDFCEGGALPVEGGNRTAEKISAFISNKQDDTNPRYNLMVWTRDWHIEPGEHFASNTLGDPDFHETWPDHCVAGTEGAEYHDALQRLERFDRVHPDYNVYKGMTNAAYSGFEGLIPIDGGAHRKERFLTLAGAIASAGLKRVDICGIAWDYCVFRTALDALDKVEGLYDPVDREVRVIRDLTAAVDPTNGRPELQMNVCGVKIINSEDV